MTVCCSPAMVTSLMCPAAQISMAGVPNHGKLGRISPGQWSRERRSRTSATASGNRNFMWDVSENGEWHPVMAICMGKLYDNPMGLGVQSGTVHHFQTNLKSFCDFQQEWDDDPQWGWNMPEPPTRLLWCLQTGSWSHQPLPHLDLQPLGHVARWIWKASGSTG